MILTYNLFIIVISKCAETRTGKTVVMQGFFKKIDPCSSILFFWLSFFQQLIIGGLKLPRVIDKNRIPVPTPLSDSCLLEF